ncbi:MAG: O-antigen polymerase, partial [Tepidanaerobacteraceae bacterium]|nr:O-antigen polymerase [Tepidanaerobacteraceae bacterium]
MGNVYRLVEKSLFFNLITFIFKPEVYEGSFFYNWLSTLSGFISRTLKGSLLRTFFTNRRWEKEAIRSSCFMTILAKLYIPINRFVIFINNSIENSYPFKVVLMAVESFITTPLSTLAYIFLPAVFLNTTLKAIFESFTPKALVYRIMLMMALFIMTSINIPLRWILFSSRFCKLCEWFSGEKVESIS